MALPETPSESTWRGGLGLGLYDQTYAAQPGSHHRHLQCKILTASCLLVHVLTCLHHMQAELDRMAQTGRVRLSPALANLTPSGSMTARCLEGGRMQLEFDSPMQSPRR